MEANDLLHIITCLTSHLNKNNHDGKAVRNLT
jgi:ribosomal protein S15P/S13E